MPKICRSVAYQTTLGITAAIQKAPVIPIGDVMISQHTLPDYQLETLAVTAGAEQISLELINPPTIPPATSPVTSVFLDVGTVLDFPGTGLTRVKVILAEAATVSGTAALFDCLPVSAAIAAAAVARTKALLFIEGCRSAIITPTIKIEDTTNYLSGKGMEGVNTGNSKKINMELDLVYNSRSHDIILDMLYGYNDSGREAYLDVVFPSGERHEGYCLLMTGTPTGAVQAKRSFTLEWQVQGECYDYTKAVIAA
jgi:hypothetical protein